MFLVCVLAIDYSYNNGATGYLISTSDSALSQNGLICRFRLPVKKISANARGADVWERRSAVAHDKHKAR